MPTVHQEGPYTFLFFSSDKGEPPHIHVQRDRMLVKYWLNPIAFAKNRGFPEYELNRIERLIVKHEVMFMEAWYAYFSS